METVSIRNLRGASLRESARSGKPLAITNHRALIGVIIPVAAAWIEHLIDYNWSHVRQSIGEGEQAIASQAPMAALDDVLTRADPAGGDQSQGRSMPQRLAIPLVAAVAGQTVTQAPQSRAIIERLQAALTLPATGQEASQTRPSVQTVRIGNLTAALIEQAGEAGQTLALTHDRELIGILIPVTPGLVQFLIEQNLSRVLYNIGLGEKQLSAADDLTMLDHVLDQEAPDGKQLSERPWPADER